MIICDKCKQEFPNDTPMAKVEFSPNGEKTNANICKNCWEELEQKLMDCVYGFLHQEEAVREALSFLPDPDTTRGKLLCDISDTIDDLDVFLHEVRQRKALLEVEMKSLRENRENQTDLPKKDESLRENRNNHKKVDAPCNGKPCACERCDGTVEHEDDVNVVIVRGKETPVTIYKMCQSCFEEIMETVNKGGR